MTVSHDSKEWKFTVVEQWGANPGPPAHPAGSATHYSPRGVRTWSDSRSEQDLPNYRQVIKRGGNASNPYSCSYRTWRPGNGYISISWKETFGNKVLHREDTNGSICGQVGLTAAASSVDITDADIQAKVKFLRSIRRTQRSFQSGVFLGELRETLQMLKRPASTLRRGLDTYYSDVKKRTRRMSGPSATRVVQDTWLEYSFGWQPLISDIRDAHKALTKPYVETRPVYGDADIFSCQDSRSFHTHHFTHYILNRKASTVAGVRYKGRVRAINNPTQRQLANWGLTTSELLPTIWELIPYSFLVDYFTNIGDLIDAATTVTSGLVWYCRTIKRESKLEVSLAPNLAAIKASIPTLQSCSSSYSGYQNHAVEYIRDIPNLSVSVTDLRFEVPGYSSRKWLNIAALSKLRK